MSREVTVRLTDEQCDALKAEADAAGVRFFDHCRAKLLANMAIPVRDPPQRRAIAAPTAEVDRIGHLEVAVGQILDFLRTGGAPAVEAEAAAVDVDDVVGGALAQLGHEAPVEQGYDRGYPDRPGDGVRHLGARKPLPLAGGAMPRHLAGLLPG